MFTKVLVANRGEIAVRVIRACRDLGIISVAVYSEADKESLHAQIADEAYCIGPAQPQESYLNINNIIETALGCGAQAIHPGYGFLSENPEFVRACAENGLAFIGPSEQSMRLLGDKVQARALAKEAGVPLAEGSDGVVRWKKRASGRRKLAIRLCSRHRPAAAARAFVSQSVRNSWKKHISRHPERPLPILVTADYISKNILLSRVISKCRFWRIKPETPYICMTESARFSGVIRS